MSTRIIIEKDGEQWEVTSDYAVFIEADGRVDILTKHTTVTMRAKELPPVERTDNSEVIARLEDENANLRDALKPIMACHEQSTSWHIDCTSAVRKAQDVMNAISRKGDDISRKGCAE